MLRGRALGILSVWWMSVERDWEKKEQESVPQIIFELQWFKYRKMLLLSAEACSIRLAVSLVLSAEACSIRLAVSLVLQHVFRALLSCGKVLTLH